jgi:hypothetical protein
MSSAASSVHRKNDTIIVEALMKAVETILQSRVQSLGATRTMGIKHRVRFKCARILCCVVCLTLYAHSRVYAVSNAQFNFKTPQIDEIRADMVWWQQDVERPLTLELRWVMEPSVAVLVEVWTATYTATAAPPSLDESALLRETYKRLTLFMRGLYTTLRALPATQVRNVERHIAFVFFFH